MARAAIETTGLGKRYRLVGRSGYRTLREAIAGALRRPSGAGDDRSLLWALRHVGLRIDPGERVGIIGRNGAGKSTLLKLLARITEPTEGEARVRGRVGSLLEVGTGFHPELTGRENIFLNGTILGMRAAEIRRKFDEIVAFAAVERFLDTPVKHYSSGMYVRLAFSVAAHLEPEILLVDEVLAVGDLDFQRKCLGKMDAVARGGRTILVVSHNLGLLAGLVARGVWLEAGRVAFDGPIHDAIRCYLDAGMAENLAAADLREHPGRLPGMRRVLERAVCRRADGLPAADFAQAEEILLDVSWEAPPGVSLAGAGFIVTSRLGVRVGGYNTYMASAPPHRLPARGGMRFTLPARQFAPGDYMVTVSIGSHPGALEDKVESAVGFTIHPSDIYGTGYLLTSEDGVAALTASARPIAPAPEGAST